MSEALHDLLASEHPTRRLGATVLGANALVLGLAWSIASAFPAEAYTSTAAPEPCGAGGRLIYGAHHTSAARPGARNFDA